MFFSGILPPICLIENSFHFQKKSWEQVKFLGQNPGPYFMRQGPTEMAVTGQAVASRPFRRNPNFLFGEILILGKFEAWNGPLFTSMSVSPRNNKYNTTITLARHNMQRRHTNQIKHWSSCSRQLFFIWHWFGCILLIKQSCNQVGWKLWLNQSSADLASLVTQTHKLVDFEC